jgi:hypothetical protein
MNSLCPGRKKIMSCRIPRKFLRQTEDGNWKPTFGTSTVR